MVLSKEDAKRRDFVLSGNMWKVVLTICSPLAIYASLNLLFRLLDTMMASHINAQSVSAVAYLSQINMMLYSLGGGLAVGGGIKISESYGAGDYEKVKKQVNSLFALCGMCSLILLLCIFPFAPTFLKLANTPDELIQIGTRYFRIELFAMLIDFFNGIYIAVERARGNSRRILFLNLMAIAVKLSTTALFVYVLHGDITMIAVASLLSVLVLFAASLYNLRKSEDVFGISLHSISLSRTIITPILHLSFPVIIEKISFSFGKVVVNSMSTAYGVLTVGALGISNNMGGITTNPQSGFQQGGAAIISQNLGAKQPRRALDAFIKLLIINSILGVIGYTLTMLFLPFLSGLFASGDEAFRQLIVSVYRYEALGAVPLGITAAVMALLYGFGYTRISLLINFCRVFVFRIPILYFLQHYTSIGSKSVGIVMMASNTLVGIMSILVAVLVIRRIHIKQHLSFSKHQKEVA